MVMSESICDKSVRHLLVFCDRERIRAILSRFQDLPYLRTNHLSRMQVVRTEKIIQMEYITVGIFMVLLVHLWFHLMTE